MKGVRTLTFVSVILFISGLIVILLNQPTTLSIVTGMILITVSIITLAGIANLHKPEKVARVAPKNVKSRPKKARRRKRSK